MSLFARPIVNSEYANTDPNQIQVSYSIEHQMRYFKYIIILLSLHRPRFNLYTKINLFAALWELKFSNQITGSTFLPISQYT